MLIEGIIPAEIAGEPEAIRETLIHARPGARDAAAALLARGTRRVFVIGNGTSYHSSLAAATLHRRHAGPDDPRVIALTAADFRTYPPTLDSTDAVLGISASGEFRDVVAVIEDLRGRVPTIGVVHVPDSALSRTADHVVLSAGGPSNVPVMTKTFAATLVATELVFAELLGPAVADAYVTGAERAADDVAGAISASEPVVESLATSLAGFEHVFVVGSGLAYIAAMEAALKLKEMALVHAEATESWEMASGAATILGPGAVVVALAPAGRGRDATIDVARHASRWGARIVEVGPVRAIDGSDLLPIAASAAEDHAPLVTVAPVALLAYLIGRRRGATPDRPSWVERYHSQGLHHIVGV